MPPKRKRYGLSKEERLKKPADFTRVYKRGKRASGETLVLYVLKNREDRNRIGFSVGKKGAGGVVRKNRIKRLLREAYRRDKDKLSIGWDLVVVARTTKGQLKLSDFQGEFLRLAKETEVMR